MKRRLTILFALGLLVFVAAACSLSSEEVLPTEALLPTATATVNVVCEPPVCLAGEVSYCPDNCPGNCGVRCATPTPDPTTQIAMCTPPPCAADETSFCPGDCPGNCGVICATLTPTVTPEGGAPSAAASGPLGFITDPHDGNGVTFFHLNGSPIGRATLPGLSEYGGVAHLAGSAAADPLAQPIVYFTFENKGELRQVVGGSAQTLRPMEQFIAMAGAPGSPVMAVSELVFAADNSVSTRLYVESVANLGGATPRLEFKDPDSYAMKPLAVLADGDQVKGVWYTMVAWGIGGDIVFEPRKGLKYLDFTTGTATQLLDRDHAPWSLSPDRSWMAFTAIGGPLSIQPLPGGTSQTFPLLPDSNRGAGNAVFSPDNHYVGWMEGSGWMMAETPDYHATIRVATSDGQLVADIPQASFNGVASSEAVTWVAPVGWIDNQTLVVEVRFQNWDQAALIAVHADGSALTYLASGTFVGFLYP